MIVQLKICPKCNATHEKSGMFCSRTCANSRVWSEADKQKKAEAFRNSLICQNQVQERRPPKFSEKLCEFCSASIRWNGGKRFCKNECYLNFYEMSRTALQNYRSKCSFKFNVYKFPEKFDLSLIEKHGWYSASNKGGNLNGVSRDHKLSVTYGFKNQIDPEIICHPANCELLVHSKNQRKYNECSISLEELLKSIEIWN